MIYDLCPDCHINWRFVPPARVDERKPDGSFGPSDHVRCDECKGVFLRPIKIPEGGEEYEKELDGRY